MPSSGECSLDGDLAEWIAVSPPQVMSFFKHRHIHFLKLTGLRYNDALTLNAPPKK